MSFHSNPDKSDLILKDSTRICSLRSYDRLQPPQKPLKKNCRQTKCTGKNIAHLNHSQMRLLYNPF